MTDPHASYDQRNSTASTSRAVTSFPWQIVLIATGSLFLGLVLANIFMVIARSLAILFIAIVIAESLSPLVTHLQRWLPRTVAVIVVYIALAALLVLLGWIVFPPMVQQAEEVIANAPDIVSRVQDWIDRWDIPGTHQSSELLKNRLGQFGTSIAEVPLTIVSTAVEIVLVFFMSLYWLLAAPALRQFILSVLPEEHRDYADETFREMGRTMGGYVRGSVIQGLIIGSLAWIGLSIIGVDYPIVLAILAGFSELIPVVGPIIAFVPIVGIALLDGLTTTIITIIYWIVIQQFENHILTPGIMHSQTQLSPLLVIFAVFLGGQVGGIVGALVAIPLAGALKILVTRVLAPWIRRWAGIPPPSGDQPEEAA